MLIGLSLPVSFAFVRDVEVINTTLSRPNVSKNGYTYHIFSGLYNSIQDIYYLTSATLTGTNDIEIFEDGTWSKSNNPYTVEYKVWNAETGVLIAQLGQTNANYNSYRNYYQTRFSSVAPNFGNVDGYYNVLPEGMIDSSNQNNANYTYSNEFINFAPVPADIMQYRSPLSEPVADEHNSYFIVNEFLYWVSYRINTIYELQNSIEGSTESYTGSGSLSEENSLVYHEDATVQWQNELAPINSPNSFYGQIANNNNDTFSGILRDLHSSSYGLGVSLGDGSFSYNGQIYVPASVSSSVYSEPYELCITTLSNKSLSIDFLRHSSLNSDILIDADVYLSIFKIEDGSYVKSEIKSVQGAYNKIGWTSTFNTDYTIDSVRMYGPAFVNTAEIPVNLSSVLWEYDIEFAQWRADMLSLIQSINNALNETPTDVEEPTSYSDPYNELNSQIENISQVSLDSINSAFDVVPASSGSVAQWVSWFEVPKLIAVCVFALAAGTVILTLGKKKSD